MVELEEMAKQQVLDGDEDLEVHCQYEMMGHLGLNVRAFDLVLVMDEVHHPSNCVGANSLWIEEPCEQQQVHEIA